MPPKDFEPADNERGAEDCRPEHYAKRGKRLIPARREASQLRLSELQLVHDLSEVVAGLGSLTKGEAVGIDLGHVACAAVGMQQTVADYRASR